MVQSDAVESALSLAAAAIVAKRNRVSRYVDDPVAFIRDELHEHPWSKQREIAEAVRDHRHVAVRSAHDTGKSFIASRIAAWWIAAHPPGTAFVVTTAPSFAQVRVILWREMNRAHARGRLPGTMNQTEWWINGEIVAYGRKPADYDDEAFQGIHSRYVLVILDEACGIPKTLWDAVETITTNEACRVMAIGNPDDPLSEFKRKFENQNWHQIHIDGLETPNFTGEEISEDPEEDAQIKSSLISKVWVEERRDEWGEGGNLWLSKVRGEFPTIPAGAVFKELNASQQWESYGNPLPHFKMVRAGVDIGGPNEKDHKTAAVIGGLVGIETEGRQNTPENALIRFAHFEHSSADVHERLVVWMKGWETKLRRRIIWRVDKTQTLGIAMLKRAGFHVEPSVGGAGSVTAGIDLQRARMANGTGFFTEDLMDVPKFLDGTPMNGLPWFTRMQNYRLVQQDDPNRAPKIVPLKRDDDTADADRYFVEGVDGTPTIRGRSIRRLTLSGKARQPGMD